MSMRWEDDPYARPTVLDEWAPSERVRGWLLAGIAALAIDLVLGGLAAALEVKHWNDPGLTPDVLLSYVAIFPQAVIVGAYLALARGAGARGLWKSAAGLFGSYVLLSLLSLVFLEGIKQGAAGIVVTMVVIGIAALSIFSVSRFPKFAKRETPAPAATSTEQDDAVTSPADAADQEATSVAPEESAKSAEPEEKGGGCWIQIAIAIVVVMLKIFTRARKNVPGNFGVDEWSLIVAGVLALFALVYAVWFAMAKINARERLGGLAAMTGAVELLIGAAHVAMAAVLIWFTFDALADPQFDEVKLDGLLDPWLRRASVASAACHAVWVLMTIWFFLALRSRGAPDWRDEFLASPPPRA